MREPQNAQLTRRAGQVQYSISSTDAPPMPVEALYSERKCNGIDTPIYRR
jgi:hypothetical protein